MRFLNTETNALNTPPFYKMKHFINEYYYYRLKVSTDTPLSTLLNYLDRKWKPLSERLLSFATKTNWHEARNQTGSCGMPSCLVLQTPSDASVNTRIMVFQVIDI